MLMRQVNFSACRTRMSGPLVSGVSPSFGPPGTKITIRGERLGNSQYDITGLVICGLNCLHWAEWHKPSMIVCRTGAMEGTGEIIVTTRSGGEGTCNVNFTSLVSQADPMVESAFWVDESEFLADRLEGGKREKRKPSIRGGNLDPLGLGDKAGKGQKVTQEFLEGLYPGGNGDLHSEKFVAAWYLLEQHRNTNFSALKLGLGTLQKEVDRKSIAPSNYAKENLAAYLLGEQSLQDLRKMIIFAESKSDGGSITEKLEGLLAKSDSIASVLFREVLQRKEKADATRNALNVLQRFKFIFSLPKSISQNIESGDIDMVVSDYERTKSLFTGGEVQVFQKVLEEVTRLVADFRRELRNRLTELPSTLDEQRRMVKYLIQLDYSGDPGWEALEHMFRWIRNLVELIRDRYQTPGPDPIPLSDLHSNIHPYGSHELWKREGETRPPKRVGMTEELCQLQLEVIPEFWALARAYLSGDLLQGISDQEVRELFSSGRREAEAGEMLQRLLELFSDMISCAFFTETVATWDEERRASLGEWKEEPEPLEEWLPFCVRQVRHCSSVLQDQLPSEATQCCVQLTADLRLHTVEKLFVRAETDTQLLHERENWSLEAEEHGSISSLPVLFESVVLETLLTLKDIVQDTPTDRPTRLLYKGSDFILSILQKLVECFRYLAFEKEPDLSCTQSLSQQEHSSSSEDLSEGEENALHTSLSDLETSEEARSHYSSDKRLLVILSNIQFIKSQVLPRILDCYKLHEYPDPRAVEQSTVHDLNELDAAVFSEYVQCKAERVSLVLSGGMSGDHFDWEECVYPVAVRGYIKELIMVFIEVHSECYSVSSLLIPNVLRSLLESTSESMLQSLRLIETFCHEGAMHAQIELTVVEKTFSRFLSPKSSNHFDRAYKYLSLEASRDDNDTIKKIIQEFQDNNRLQLLCFKSDI